MSYDPETRPEASNLLTIYAALSDSSVEDVAAEFSSAQFSDFKTRLAELCVEKLAPINAAMRGLMGDPAHIDSVLRDGAERAAAIAEPILKEVYDLVGFLRVQGLRT
jgi:tryptophanyl-tRNA synthetase